MCHNIIVFTVILLFLLDQIHAALVNLKVKENVNKNKHFTDPTHLNGSV